VAFELLVEAFELALLAAFEELGDEAGDTEEAHAPSLLAGGDGEGRGQVGLAGARVPDEEDVLVAVHVVAPDEFPHQLPVDRRLSAAEGAGLPGVWGMVARPQSLRQRITPSPWGSDPLSAANAPSVRCY